MENPGVTGAKSMSSYPATTSKFKDGDGNTLDEEEDTRLKQEQDEEEAKRYQERANRNMLIFLSMLLMLAMPIVIWRCISEPRLIAWRLSLLLCVCSTIWSRLLDATMSVKTTLLFFSSSFLLALYADAALDAEMGVLIAHLNSHFAAGMLGHALAERRQRDGTEVSAGVAAAANPTTEKDADNLFYYQTLGALYFTMITLCFGARVAWVVWHRAEYPTAEGLLLHVFTPLALIVMLWTVFVGGMLLQGALIGETGLCLLIMCSLSVTLLYIVVLCVVGEFGASLFILHGLLGSSGFLGYSLSVYASFKLRLNLLQLADESKVESPLRSKLKPD